jgi:hypothetical protein
MLVVHFLHSLSRISAIILDNLKSRIEYCQKAIEKGQIFLTCFLPFSVHCFYNEISNYSFIEKQ